jgi:hypothetical protein
MKSEIHRTLGGQLNTFRKCGIQTEVLMKTDYLIVGSGLSALVFGSLMAKSGKKVQILEAHEYPGGFGHTFTMAKKYKFNAQLHYVWDCGEGHTVNRVLKKLNLDKEVTFDRYDPNGFDRMRMPGYSLFIPSESQVLIQRLSDLFPQDADQIRKFVLEVQKTSEGLKKLSPPVIPSKLFKHFGEVSCAVMYLKSTLQDVFDKFNLPKEAQTLLALQWPDFLLPPDQLSFYAWVILFTGYQQGAFYPTQHFEHVINSLVKVIVRIKGGVYSYIEKILERFKGEILVNVDIREIFRQPDSVKIGLSSGENYLFDKVVFATPPDQVIKLLSDPTNEETKRFSAWQKNQAKTVIHTDTSMYGRHGIKQSSEFDFFQTDKGWGYNAYLNQLCGISSSHQYSLAFNLDDLIAKDKILHIQEHHTPLYTVKSFRYRNEIIITNGENNTYHAGAYLADGLHEGAITSAIRVVQLIG